MSFNKLNIALQEALKEEGIHTLYPLQEEMFSKIKSGADYMLIAPKGSGKTFSFIINIVQRVLSTKPTYGPRALVLVKDKKAALELEQLFKDITLMMDIDVFAIFDSQQIYNQKDTIYTGVDIVIATPQRMYEIYKEEGINFKQLKMFVIEDAELLINNKHIDDIERISEGIGKCQRIVYANEYIPRFDEILETFMNKGNKIFLS